MPNLHVYLPPQMRDDAMQGKVNIINRIGAAVGQAGYGMAYHGDTPEDRARAVPGPDLHLFHMQEPNAPNVLTLRRAYTYPFWQIEATNERWNFSIARERFDRSLVDLEEAQAFFRRWRKRLLGEGARSQEGFIFMPLQGRLREHRSFQTMSPKAMIEACLQADPRREIRATLHPKEVYDPEDFAMLETVSQRFPRFQLIKADARELLWRCDYVVTQNSSLALSGFFAKKPAVLFAGIDFHHIAGSVARDGVAAAFAQIEARAPFVPYLYWFFKTHMINGGAEDAEAQILARMRACGWPV